MIKNIVTIYTDGACSPNPGVGGYAAILSYNGIEKIVVGGMYNTTSNQMELFAVIRALETLTRRCKIKVFSDSTYVINLGRKEKMANKNRHLCARLFELQKKFDISYEHVKGHGNCVGNNRADRLAVSARLEMSRLKDAS